MFFALIGLCVFIYFTFYLVCFCFMDSDIALGFASRFGKKIATLKGKVVFITGASSGIGEHLAIALAQNGVKLVLAARRQNELERVKMICLEKSKGKLEPNDIMVLPMDMLDFNRHQKYFDQAINHFGHLNILVNNAGRSQRAMWEDIELAVDKEMFDLNVHSVISFTRIAVKYFKDMDEGHVAVTSSLAGVIGVPFSASYTGTKHAIHGYYNSLRNEKTGKDLAVSIFCPGPTFTNFLAQCFTESSGETFNIDTSATDRRMTGERCGYLCAVALANKLNESWMALFPLIPFVYVGVYFPNVFNIAMKIMGPKKLFKLRDSKITMENVRNDI